MSRRHGPMHLSLFVNPTGHHQASWRHPRAEADAGVSLAHYRRLAELAEAAHFDMMFLADNQTVRPGPADVRGRVAQYVANFEPLTLVGALMAVTSRLGFVATASTSYNYPFQIARKFASLDHLGGGRVGWNMVTSGFNEESGNFGRDQHFEHDEAYERAHEFVETCLGLWDSWEPDAFPRDKESGIFSDQSKMHVLDHRGPSFAVRGPLNVPRPPQGRPVLVQAGMSPAGMDFAARFGEIIFVMPQTLDDAREAYAEIKGRARAYGRNPDHLKVMPGLSFTTGPTRAAAEADFGLLQELLHPDVALHMLSFKLRADLSGLPLDEPPPETLDRYHHNSRYDLYMKLARREGLTLRQLAVRAAGANAGLVLCDSGKGLAEMMEEWFEQRGADGFQIQPSFLPGGFDDYLEHVHPHLVARHLVRQAYDTSTLRGHFGLPIPKWGAAAPTRRPAG